MPLVEEFVRRLNDYLSDKTGTWLEEEVLMKLRAITNLGHRAAIKRSKMFCDRATDLFNTTGNYELTLLYFLKGKKIENEFHHWQNNTYQAKLKYGNLSGVVMTRSISPIWKLLSIPYPKTTSGASIIDDAGVRHKDVSELNYEKQTPNNTRASHDMRPPRYAHPPCDSRLIEEESLHRDKRPLDDGKQLDDETRLNDANDSETCSHVWTASSFYNDDIMRMMPIFNRLSDFDKASVVSKARHEWMKSLKRYSGIVQSEHRVKMLTSVSSQATRRDLANSERHPDDKRCDHSPMIDSQEYISVRSYKGDRLEHEGPPLKCVRIVFNSTGMTKYVPWDS